MTTRPLSQLSPVAGSWCLPRDYHRHDPGSHDLRQAIDALAGRRVWAGLS